MNAPGTAIIEELRERIQRLESGPAGPRPEPPAGGGNGVVDGSAAALFAAGIAARTRGKVLWCVTRQDLFAPAVAQAGLAPDRVIYVEAGDEKTVLACFE